MMKDIYPGANHSQIQNLLIFKNQHGLWTTDGTEEGTSLLKEFYNYSYGYLIYNDELYFSAQDQTNTYDKELWNTDGTEAGTVLAVDLREGNQSSNAKRVFVYSADSG